MNIADEQANSSLLVFIYVTMQEGVLSGAKRFVTTTLSQDLTQMQK